jgi:signal peptidase
MKKKKISIWQIISYVLYGIVILFALFALSSKLPIPGNYKLFTVMSGSMEPTIKTGSLVVVKPAKEYKVNDIITFKNQSDPKSTTTHRLIETKTMDNSTYGITKGDANNGPDAEKVYQDMIIGKVRFSIPYLGYPIHFSKTLPGLIIFIIIPATIIIYDEILKIKEEIKNRRRKK